MTTISSNNSKIVCYDCHIEHPDTMGNCTACGACLYKNSKQDMEAVERGYPIVICEKCGQRNFWD